MARQKFICGNWKMHKTVAEAAALVKELVEGLAGDARVLVAVAPPFTSLGPVAAALRGTPVELAAQDVHWEAQGAFTGEISATMLADVGVKHGIVGHSERRQSFGETDETVRKKVGALLAAGLRPIVCVGELLAEREAGQTLEVVGRQVRGGLAGLAPTPYRLPCAIRGAQCPSTQSQEPRNCAAGRERLLRNRSPAASPMPTSSSAIAVNASSSASVRTSPYMACGAGTSSPRAAPRTPPASPPRSSMPNRAPSSFASSTVTH